MIREKVGPVAAFRTALVIKNSLEEVFMHYQGAAFIMAHEKEPITQQPVALSSGEHVLMVGPEGGFSNREVELCEQAGGEMISLGQNRLRAETSVTAILSQYLFC